MVNHVPGTKNTNIVSNPGDLSYYGVDGVGEIGDITSRIMDVMSKL